MRQGIVCVCDCMHIIYNHIVQPMTYVLSSAILSRFNHQPCIWLILLPRVKFDLSLMGKSSTLIELATGTSPLPTIKPYSDKSLATAAAGPAHIGSLHNCRYLPWAISHSYSLLAASCPTLLPLPFYCPHHEYRGHLT